MRDLFAGAGGKVTRRLRRTHCSDCGIELNAETGYRKSHHRGWHSQCKECKRVARRQANQEREAQNRMFVDREFCDICHQPERQTRSGEVRMLNKDHDHSTGEWRGLLCSRCNAAIGMFNDNVELMLSAIRYLQNPPGLVLLDDQPAETRQLWRQADWYLAKYGPWTPDGTHPPSPAVRRQAVAASLNASN